MDNPLKNEDGAPVVEIPGVALVWWQDTPIPREAWFDLAQPECNGWMDSRAA